MKRINKGKRSTEDADGQQTEMSPELRALKFATAIEQLEIIIERALRARFVNGGVSA